MIQGLAVKSGLRLASRLPAVKRLTLEMFWLGVGQVAAVAGSIASVRFLTDTLPPAKYGEVILSFTIVNFVTQLLLGPLINGFTRFFIIANEAGELPGYFKALVRLLSHAVLLLLLVGTLAALALSQARYDHWLPLLATAFIYSILFNISSVFDGIQNAARHRPVVAWHLGASTWLRLILALEFIFLVEPSSSMVMAGYTAGSILLLLSQFYFFRRNIRPLMAKSRPAEPAQIARWAGQIRSYAWPFASWGLFTWVEQSSDRWALQSSTGSTDVGRYGALYQLGYTPLMQLAVFATQVFSPVVFQRAGDASDPERLKRSHQLSYALFAGMVLLTLLVAGMALVCHHQVFRWMVAPEYRTASSLWPGVVIAGGLFAASQTGVLVLLSGIRSRALIVPKIVTAIIATLLNFAGAHWLGLKGVVLAGMASSFIHLGWVLWLLLEERSSRKPDPGEK